VDDGWKVAALGRRLDKLEEAARGLAGVRTFACDVADEDRVSQVAGTILGDLGPVSLLINNAGVNFKRRSLQAISLADWRAMLDINLTGAYLVIQAFLPSMRTLGGGLIINISSVAALRPGPLGGAAYSASKAGLNALSATLTLEEAARGIRSTVICPGEIDTPLLDERPEPVPAERRAVALRPDDVAEAIRFVSRLPAGVHIPEMIIKPTVQAYS
jgi:NAD(P)-dependent dehydrogenase (short-subunit alcohol dehydrogenase family)